MDFATYQDSISAFKSNAIEAFGKIFEIESLSEYPNLTSELESLVGCDPAADGDCNLKLLCTKDDDDGNGSDCNRQDLRKCILKILLSQITKGIDFDRLHHGPYDMVHIICDRFRLLCNSGALNQL